MLFGWKGGECLDECDLYGGRQFLLPIDRKAEDFGMSFGSVIDRPVYWTPEIPNHQGSSGWIYISRKEGRGHGRRLLPKL
ncbi:MAG: hypothetical protein A3H25_10595 [Sphingomonadales bacterium RIFCSPLOWO2_12_FULL_63_15]|nr:MAG: hypothetical protein A3H25_10595 [Sphingomonadales bacterium RIFCSPLOWO2_12_FULL_63_15]